MRPRIAGNALPAFLQLAGHPLRWALLHELARSDRDVAELTRLLGEPQSLLSYHLGRLRGEGLVLARRSARDGRHTYYRTDLDRCAGLLAATGRALYPGLDLLESSPRLPRVLDRPARVLFLCTGNSARSQMAEALLRDASRGAVHAESAGNHPRPVHPNAVCAMAARGLDISRQRSKHLDDFAGQSFDHVVTLCDRVREHCPGYPGASVAHWSVPDPVDMARPDDETYPAFEAAADELATRIRYFLSLVAA